MNSDESTTVAQKWIPEENQYLLTFRDEHGKIIKYLAKAASMTLAVEENRHPFELIKVERLDPETGLVLGGLYNE